MKNKFSQFILLAGTVMGLAGINYSILHTPFVFIVVLIMLAHEFGHYFAAKFADADPDLPYFIPLPMFTVGVTRIRRMKLIPYASRKRILLLGPITASLTAFIFLLLSMILFPNYIIPLSLLLFGEIVFNYFGSDGRKYREYNFKEQQQWNY